MSIITWVTPRGNIGRVPEGEFFSIQLQANNPSNTPLRFRKVSGDIPPGMLLEEATGRLFGVPYVSRDSEIINYQFAFTIRASNEKNQIADRRFEIIITNIQPIKIVPREENLGAYYDGIFFSRQLFASSFDPDIKLKWELLRGQLPTGITLSSSGLLSGYLTPIRDTTGAQPGWDSTPWDSNSWEFIGRFISKTFNFTVQVSNVNSAEIADNIYNIDRIDYTIKIVDRSSFTADSNIYGVNELTLSIDSENKHVPIILTAPDTLSSTRQDDYFNFKFDAVDFDGDAIVYQIINTDFPLNSLGLYLDESTGWLTGLISPQESSYIDYKFQLVVKKRDFTSYVSKPINYTLKVFGSLSNAVVWETDANVGTIENGQISTFSVRAVSPANKPLFYERKYKDPGRLPPGLMLLPTGLISGQCTFQHFTLDPTLTNHTTIDGGATTFDCTYNFNVVAKDYYSNVQSEKTFTIRVNNINSEPYQNLYLKALLTQEQRTYFDAIIADNNLFPKELVYRIDDPYFGKASSVRCLFAAGFTPSTMSQFAQAMATNHYDKKLVFGEIKTARALDDQFRPLYEVVYVEIIDTASATKNGRKVSPKLITNLSGTIKTPYYDEQGQAKTLLNPNSFDNMIQVVGDQLGYINRGALPTWMISRQEDNTVPGLVQALVLAYTIPGGSDLIAFRLKNKNIDFGKIDFVADRYEVDLRGTKNYNIATGQFLADAETTFDSNLSRGILIPSGEVDYAVTVSYNDLVGKSKSQLQTLAAIDGVINFVGGETLIFVQQEGFNGSTNPDAGWILPNNETIPGYKENALNSAIPNKRAGVWEIVINNNVIDLNFVRSISLNSQLLVKKGNFYQNTNLFYNPVVQPGKTVPEYSPVRTQALDASTTFDGGGTKFFTYINNYTVPTDNNKYLKFPQIGVIK